MATICTGSEFEQDADGKLKVSICGDPPDVTNPCGTDNALLRDPACGLYVPAIVAGVKTGGTGRATFGVNVSPGETENDQRSFTITNPSSCLSASVLGLAEHVIEVSIGPGEGVHLVSSTSANQATNPARALTLYNDGAAARVYTVQLSDTFSAGLTPGETRTFYFNRGVEGIVGTTQIVALTSGYRAQLVTPHRLV